MRFSSRAFSISVVAVDKRILARYAGESGSKDKAETRRLPVAASDKASNAAPIGVVSAICNCDKSTRVLVCKLKAETTSSDASFLRPEASLRRLISPSTKGANKLLNVARAETTFL